VFNGAHARARVSMRVAAKSMHVGRVGVLAPRFHSDELLLLLLLSLLSRGRTS